MHFNSSQLTALEATVGEVVKDPVARVLGHARGQFGVCPVINGRKGGRGRYNAIKWCCSLMSVSSSGNSSKLEVSSMDLTLGSMGASRFLHHQNLAYEPVCLDHR